MKRKNQKKEGNNMTTNHPRRLIKILLYIGGGIYQNVSTLKNTCRAPGTSTVAGFLMSEFGHHGRVTSELYNTGESRKSPRRLTRVPRVIPGLPFTKGGHNKNTQKHVKMKEKNGGTVIAKFRLIDRRVSQSISQMQNIWNIIDRTGGVI